MSLVGKKVRQYKILSRLGQGGMGAVYEAFDQTLQRKVALKAIRAGRGLDPLARDRFLREARILSQLDHPGICRIHDYITVGEDHFLVLELIEGATLTALRDDLDRTARLRVAREIAAALAAAHAEDIVHRDLKPDNVMITAGHRVKVLDFGLARTGGSEEGPPPQPPADQPVPTEAQRTVALDVNGSETTLALDPAGSEPAGSSGSAYTTMPGAVLGTPAFMSPEQAQGEPVGPASDMYSFGLILHWILTGEPGYEQTVDVVRLLEDVKEGRTTPLAGRGLDAHLVRLTEQLKSRSRAARPTAAATVHRLDWILDKPRRRSRRLIALAAAVAVLLFAGKYTLDVRAQRQLAERRREEAESLIEFMVGDLRKKLEPVGRLDVLADVGNRALKYYSARAEEDLSDPDLYRLVRTLTQIGEVRLGEGRLAAADSAFARARASARELVSRDDRDTRYLAALAATDFWRGSVRYSEGDLEAAAVYFDSYYTWSHRLHDLEPDDPAWLLEIGYATTNLAALNEARGDLEGAVAYLDSSIAIKRKLVDADPDDSERLSSLANSLAWAGRTRMELGELEASLDRLLQGEEAVQTLSDRSPRDMDRLSLLATQHQLVGNALEQLGRNEEARRKYEADLTLARRLSRHDPANMTWRLEEATSLRTLGRLLTAMGDLETARDYLEEARDIEDAVLAGSDPPPAVLQGRGLTAFYLASVTAAEGRRGAALVEIDQMLPRLEVAAGGEDADEEQVALAQLHVLRSELLTDLSRPAEAATSRRRAEDILAPRAAGSRDPAVLVPWIRLCILNGDRKKARDAAKRLAGFGFARTDYLAFCRRNNLPTVS